ncbi:hypothetical protein AJ79_10243 [Helicocarpus griseus UAMH5409]|uniref:Uncharacterized protein n=1 Tax=Helicocarpus griseus UAMH5409 TaxID=1447875 RepID=A0A2B7W6I7_9EURO|nr:hypothetical protein AJ79_10243 [Helicocarpus griseus UAMH5409]
MAQQFFFIQQQPQPRFPNVYHFIPMQNAAHPANAAIQAVHPFPGNMIENHNAGQANNGPPVANAANNPPAAQAVMNGQIAVQPNQAAAFPPQPVQPQPQVFAGGGWMAPGAAQQQQAWFAPNPQQLHAQNVAAAQANGANLPRQLVPFNPPAGQAWWVRLLDGSWTLRPINEIHNKLNGQWRTSVSGAPWFEVQGKP